MCMVKTFRQAFLDNLERTQASLAHIARQTGVSVEQLKKVKQREHASTNVDDAVKVAHYFGMSMDEFLDDRTIALRGEVLALYAQLTPSERQLLQDLAKARRVPGQAEG